MRLFLAIDPPDPVREALEGLQSHLRVGRLSDPDTLHLTLAFLGERSEPEAEALDEAMQGFVAAAFDLTLAGLGSFGGAMPAILFAGVVDPGPVTALHRAVRARLRQAGIILPRERFRPHVTLARFGRRVPQGAEGVIAEFLASHAGFRSPPFRVSALTLFESHLSADGARHEVLAQYPLRG
ncbi:RNA 2',3'-cyclic phosphodiesterase [Pseudooceanicola sp.]|uniref:RNA 2',3'-cyclic phosphodiesterase n=1 Tax=Pseudooceanicola sp. TaxID=1914328 RepID=UPI00260842FE|nr:RNA 2',3'-cyclic phosphodiesterase [Pseudooceanicola sp.]MDF1857072.1 RNA 2',3'-cyclic phosphodiesterase [Pseudooceanicola sp.]